MSGGKDKSETAPTKLDPLFKQYMGRLFRESQPALGEAAETAAGMQPAMLEAWQSLMNPGVNPQLGLYQQDVQRNLTENIMPQIQSAGIGASGLGGSRTAQAYGLAGERANQQITDMATQLYSADRNRMMDALGMAGQIAGIGQTPYLTQAGIMGSPVTVGGGGKSRGKELGL